MTEAVGETIGVVGAGTMGAGIAQLAAQAGARTLLHDPVPAALEKGIAIIAAGLDKLVARGRLAPEQRATILARIEPVPTTTAFAPCDMVIEAAPERVEVKLEIFRALAQVVSSDCVLATNTSSLAVTEIAAGVPVAPERVVGLHFFNPAPVMKLVEVVAGVASSPAALAKARAVGQAMGRHVIDAADVAGFLVNRCNRPYSLEALRILEAGVATVEQIDRIMRQSAGFRMGPFELMDLIGLETNHAVAEGLFRASFGEPRYQPSPLQARMIAAGRLGRKTGTGWYEYPTKPRTDAEPLPRSVPVGDARVLDIKGHSPIADSLAASAKDAGFVVRGAESADREPAWLTLVCDGAESASVTGPQAWLLHLGSLHACQPAAAGFHAVGPVVPGGLMEITSTARTEPDAMARLRDFAAAIGQDVEHVIDTPGLITGRIICQLINEAAFAIGAGNASEADVDAGLTLGVNHPRGPVAWSKLLGLDHVVGVLDALHDELGEERYRVAPLLRRCHATDPAAGLQAPNL